MRGVEFSRKALSPLIATILLIAFAVSLGTMFMSLTLGGDDHGEENACENTQIELQQISDGDAICYNPQTQNVRFLLKNTGQETIDSFILRIIDPNQDYEEQQVQAQLESGGLGSFEIAYQTVSPNNLVAAIIPIVNEDTCPASEIEEIRIPLC